MAKNVGVLTTPPTTETCDSHPSALAQVHHQLMAGDIFLCFHCEEKHGAKLAEIEVGRAVREVPADER